jgi:predicted acylesterase/phospholipase RssA
VEPLNTIPFEHGLSGWQVLKSHLNPFGTPRPVPNVVDILTRSTGLSQIRQRRAVLARDSIDLLLHPPIAALGALDFKGGVALIEAGYRYAADVLTNSELADRFVI